MKLDFKFNKRLGSFTLDVKEEFDGGITGVFGPSGSGKTTFLHCLSGFIKPDEGHIRFNDQDFFSSAARVHCPVEKRHIGMVFQDALLFPHMTMKQNICYGLRGERKNKKQVNEMLDILNLFHLTDRYPQNLSGGERQRVALARALIRKPSLLLMDEPISSVDLKARSQILIYLKKVHQVIKVPLIYVSHSVSEMLFLAD